MLRDSVGLLPGIPIRRAARGALLAAVLAAPAARAQTDTAAALEAVRADETRRVEVLRRITPSVVCVFDSPHRGGGGSGVIIDPRGYGLTNFHVVESFLESRRGVGGLSDGRLYPLRVLGVDPAGDVAMFRLEGKEQFDAATLADSDALRVGQWVAALGNPFLLAEDFAPTVTLGVISGLHRYQYGQGNLLEYADCIQVSTSINPGNSGGPLFDADGRLIGINGRGSFEFEERGRVNVGLGYAISVNQIKRFLPALRSGRVCEHGTLGATVQMSGSRVIFNAIQELSPAQRGGVKLGDELLMFAGRRIQTPNDFANIVTTLPANWPVAFRLRRDEREIAAAARLERVPVKLPAPYPLDLAHNHAEALALFAQYREIDLKHPAGAADLRWRGRVSTRGAPAQPFEVDVRQTAAARVIVALAGGERLLEVDAAAEPTSPATDAASEPGRSELLWREWTLLVAALLAPPEMSAGWEFLGGDEVDGRICAVVERRWPDGRRLRWKFDEAQHALAQMSAGTEREPEQAVWTPSNRREIADGQWPHTWTRRSGGIELVFDVTEASFASPGPAGGGRP